MLKLVTGLPGAGKTSNELWDFLHNKDYENRPKYCTPIKGFNAAEHGVTEIEHINVWRDLPDGCVVIVDEVQRFCGTDLGREAPDWVQDFAVHRHTGKDFVFITQSPMFIHPFARKLANPHVNYHRPWNMKGVRYTWEGVQNDPSSKAAKNAGQSQLVKTDPKVFTLYTSTVLDTHKAKPPYKIIATIAIGSLVAISGFIYALFFIMGLMKGGTSQATHVAETAAIAATSQAASVPAPNGFGVPASGPKEPVWTEETMKPRVSSMPYTAPVYDGLTTPTDFPRVAACMSSESRGTCNCYTQQATPVDVPYSACVVYVRHGSFDPWLTGRKQHGQQQPVESKQQQTAGQSSVKASTRPATVPVNVVMDTSTFFLTAKDAFTGRP